MGRPAPRHRRRRDAFADRARSATAAFDPTDAERSALADLCTRLDGMPLAIELTAARTNAFTVTQLSERIDDRFRLLTGGSRTALPRQQTLQAVTDWSYDLLFDHERRVFERLSVFAGSCTLEAAEWVCADDQLSHADVGSIVGRLVDKSLLVTDGSGRYRLLQTLAQYGRERLVARDDNEAVRDRHAEYYRVLAERSWVDWRQAGGRPQTWWIAQLTDELDNLRAALTWSIGRADARRRSCSPVHWRSTGGAVAGPRKATAGSDRRSTARASRRRGRTDWRWRGTPSSRSGPAGSTPRSNGSPKRSTSPTRRVTRRSSGWRGRPPPSWPRSTVKSTSPWPPRPRPARARSGRGAMDQCVRRPDALLRRRARRPARGSEREIVAAIELFRSVGDVCSVVTSLDQLIREQQTLGRYEAAEESVRKARDVSAVYGLRGWHATMTTRLASLIRHDDPEGAAELHRAALDVGRELALPDVEATTLDGLGLVWRRAGDLDEARRCHEESRRVSSRFRTARGAARSGIQLGYVSEAEGDTEAATRYHNEALAIAHDRADERGIASAIEGLASAAVASDDVELAAMLLSHAALPAPVVRRRSGTTIGSTSSAPNTRFASELGERFDAVFEAGRDHDLDELLVRAAVSSAS